MAQSCITKPSNTFKDQGCTAATEEFEGPQAVHDDCKPSIAVYLPRNTCLSELAACLNDPLQGTTVMCLERNILNDQLKALTLYLQLVRKDL